MTEQEFASQYFTEEQVMVKLGKSRKTLRNWYYAGKGPARTPEGLYPIDEFKKWTDRRTNRNNVKSGSA